MVSLKSLVILPTFNEKDNIAPLISTLLKADFPLDICVVDDSSPDGTLDVIRRYLQDHPTLKSRVHLIVRPEKCGRGKAIRDGFMWGIHQEKTYDVFIEMDCDFSHDPQFLSRGVSLLQEGSDVAVGSRYPNGIIAGWPLHRKILSVFANLLAQLLISKSIYDYTSGFRFYRRHAVAYLLDRPQCYTGYIYLSETLAHLLKGRFRIRCFPITFMNRIKGKSNLSWTEVARSFTAILKIAWNYHYGK